MFEFDTAGNLVASLPNGGVDAFGRCLRCGVYCPSTAGCFCYQMAPAPRRRTFIVTIEEVEEPVWGGNVMTLRPYDSVTGGGHFTTC